MMKKLIILILPFFLIACVSEDQADAKMAKGCKAGIISLLDEDYTIDKVNFTNYSDEDFDGGLHRRVTMNVVEDDGWASEDKEYSCLFMQKWGLFKSSHAALLVQIKMDERIVGKGKGAVIQGSFQDFLSLIDTVDNAMNQ